MQAGNDSSALQRAAQEALAVQDACNLSGVLNSLHEIVLDDLAPEIHRQGKGTEYINSHPIVSLFLFKLVSLNRTDCFCSNCTSAYARATAECEKIATGLNDETNGTGVRP